MIDTADIHIAAAGVIMECFRADGAKRNQRDLNGWGFLYGKLLARDPLTTVVPKYVDVTAEHRALAEEVIDDWIMEDDQRTPSTLVAQAIALGMGARPHGDYIDKKGDA